MAALTLIYGACLVASLFLLWWASDRTVDYTLAFAKDIGISPFVMGAFFTAALSSLPELVVTIISIIQGIPSLSVGDVLGSNLCDVSLVLFIPTLLASKLSVTKGGARTLISMLSVSAVGMLAFLSLNPVPRWLGLIFFATYTYFLIFLWKKQVFPEVPKDPGEPDVAHGRSTMRDFLGFIGFASLTAIFGASVVWCSEVLSGLLNLSLGIIGAIFIAIGTSLPEIAIGVSAVRRGATDLVLGNSIGSILSQALLVLGVCTSFSPVPIKTGPFVYTAPYIVIMYSFLSWRLYRKHKVTLLDTTVLVVAYFVYYFSHLAIFHQ